MTRYIQYVIFFYFYVKKIYFEYFSMRYPQLITIYFLKLCTIVLKG